MNNRERIRSYFEDGPKTREQCQEIATELGMKSLNWAFGTRKPLLRQRPDGLRELA